MKLRALLTLRSHCQRSQCSGHMKILSVSCIESLLFDRYLELVHGCLKESLYSLSIFIS